MSPSSIELINDQLQGLKQTNCDAGPLMIEMAGRLDQRVRADVASGLDERLERA